MLRPYPKQPIHVVAACLRDGERALVTQRAMAETEGGQWEFPGGKCEPGEDWCQALEREIREELSLNIVAKFPFGSWYREHDDEAFVVHLMSTQLKGQLEQIQLSVHQDTRWVSMDNEIVLEWAGRDGEMAVFLADAFKPMS